MNFWSTYRLNSVSAAHNRAKKTRMSPLAAGADWSSTDVERRQRPIRLRRRLQMPPGQYQDSDSPESFPHKTCAIGPPPTHAPHPYQTMVLCPLIMQRAAGLLAAGCCRERELSAKTWCITAWRTVEKRGFLNNNNPCLNSDFLYKKLLIFAQKTPILVLEYKLKLKQNEFSLESWYKIKFFGVKTAFIFEFFRKIIKLRLPWYIMQV